MTEKKNQCIHCSVESCRHLREEEGLCALEASRWRPRPWPTPATPPMKACAGATKRNEQETPISKRRRGPAGGRSPVQRPADGVHDRMHRHPARPGGNAGRTAEYRRIGRDPSRGKRLTRNPKGLQRSFASAAAPVFENTAFSRHGFAVVAYVTGVKQSAVVQHDPAGAVVEHDNVKSRKEIMKKWNL